MHESLLGEKCELRYSYLQTCKTVQLATCRLYCAKKHFVRVQNSTAKTAFLQSLWSETAWSLGPKFLARMILYRKVFVVND